MAPTRKLLWPDILFLAGALIVAFVLRIQYYSDAFPNGRFRPWGVDPFLHMRRIDLALRTYPHLPLFDPYLCYPKGDFTACRPFIHLAVATVAMTLGAGSPSKLLVDRVAAFFPPVIGILTLIPAFFLARRLFGKTTAYLSTTFIALLPANVAVTMIGRIDFDVLEIFFGVCLVWLIGCAVSVERRRLLCAGVAGGILAIAFSAWHACLFFVAVVCGFAWVQATIHQMQRKEIRPLLLPLAVVFAVTSIALLPFCLGAPPTAGAESPILGLSLADVGLNLLALAYVGFLWMLSRACARRNLSWGWFAGASVLIPLCAVGLAAAILPSRLEPFKASIRILIGSDPVINMIASCEGMFRLGGEIRPEVAEVSFTRAIYLFPLAFGWLIYQAIQSKGNRPDTVLFLTWTAAGTLLALDMKRFSGQFSIWYCLCLAAALVQSWPHFLRLRNRLSVNRPAAIGFWAAVVIVILLLLMPGIAYFIPISRKYDAVAEKYKTILPPHEKALAWLRENSPPTPIDGKPQHAVIAEWHWGHWIEYLTGRPVVSNPESLNLGMRDQFLEVAHFLFAEDEATANEIARRHDVRYVITTFFARDIRQYAMMAGIDANRYVHVRDIGEERPIFALQRDYYLTIASRLHDNNGAEFRIPDTGEVVPALHHYRLIYEGEPDEREDRRAGFLLASVKIFEFVKGARLVGKARPRRPVSAAVEVASNQRRSFMYRASALAGDDGRFEIVVPYPTIDSDPRYGTCATLPYAVFMDEQTASVDAPEQAVMNGEEISIPPVGP